MLPLTCLFYFEDQSETIRIFDFDETVTDPPLPPPPPVVMVQLRSIAEWMKSLPYEHKVFIGGNHDQVMESIGTCVVKYERMSLLLVLF